MTTYDDDTAADLTEPADIEAERYTLAAMMMNPQAVIECAEVVSRADFYRPLHQEIFNALVMMLSAGEPVTPVTLSAWLKRDGIRHDPLYLAELSEIPIVAAMGAAHARLVWDQSVRRRISELGARMSQLSGAMDMEPGEMLARAAQMINRVARHATPDDGNALRTAAFLAQTGRATEPVIAGLLDHQERAIFVGGEGTGKTTVLFQMAFAVAAGVHPFADIPIPPRKVLIIDLENPVEILKRRVARLQRNASGYPGWDDRNLTIFARPGGVELTNPGAAYKLAEIIRAEQPDLIVAGPIYKMLPQGESAEWHHATVCRFWDVMRARYDSAICLETHAPMQVVNGQRQMRPLGSGVYARWTEFGISLTRNGKGDLTLARFKGDREEGRSWPEKLVRNSQGGWPWAAVYPPGTFIAH